VDGTPPGGGPSLLRHQLDAKPATNMMTDNLPPRLADACSHHPPLGGGRAGRWRYGGMRLHHDILGKKFTLNRRTALALVLRIATGGACPRRGRHSAAAILRAAGSGLRAAADPHGLGSDILVSPGRVP
jgi:hypothetical protein